MKALVVDVKKNFLLTLASIVSMVLVVTFLVGLPRASAQDTRDCQINGVNPQQI